MTDQSNKKKRKSEKDISAKPVWDFRLGFVFLFILVVFILTRWLTLWYCPPNLLDGEDLSRGMLPLHLMRGLLMPYYLYQYDTYAGGGMVIGLVAYPFFTWLGPTLLALQISALVFSLGLLVGMYYLTLRFFNKAAAICLGILILFPPFFYLRTTLVPTGNHLEIGTFYVLGLYLFFASRQPAKSRFEGWLGRYGLLFFFGVVSGFAIYFEYEYLILLVAVAPFFWLSAYSWKAVLVETGLVLIGIRVGLIPWYQFHGDIEFVHYMRAFAGSFQNTTVGSYNDPKLFVEALTTNLVSFFQSCNLRTPAKMLVTGQRIDQMLFGLWVASFVYLAYQYRNEALDFAKGIFKKSGKAVAWRRGHVAVVLLAYVPIHLVVYGLHKSYQPIPPFRYLHPLFPFYFLITAFALGLLWERGKKAIAFTGLAIAVFGGVAGNLGFYLEGFAGHGMIQPGYETRYFHTMLAQAYPSHIDMERIADDASSVFPGREQAFYAGTCAGIAYLNGITIDGHLDAAQKEGEGTFGAFVAGLGSATIVSENPDQNRMKSIQHLFDEDLIPWFEKGRRMGKNFRQTY